eukprot:3160220-Alexandrium_andersonii.AAC.1
MTTSASASRTPAGLVPSFGTALRVAASAGAIPVSLETAIAPPAVGCACHQGPPPAGSSGRPA